MKRTPFALIEITSNNALSKALLTTCTEATLAAMAFVGKQEDLPALRSAMDDAYRLVALIIGDHLETAVRPAELSNLRYQSDVAAGVIDICVKRCANKTLMPYHLRIVPHSGQRVLERLLSDVPHAENPTAIQEVITRAYNTL